MTAQNFPELRAAVQAMRDLPEILKPFTTTGTKLRLPKEIGDPLCDLVSQLRPILDGVHYEGVAYEYEDDLEDRLQAARDVEAEYRAERRRSIAERREQISKDNDASRAILETEGVLWAVHGLADVLSQDTVRDDEDWVLSIASSIIDQTERVIEFLDRPGGWSQGGAS